MVVEKVNTKKYFMKIQFTLNDNLPLNKQLKFHEMTIIVRSVFEENGKFYQKIF